MTFNSKEYWEQRYAQVGNSGAGSYGKLCEFKAYVINKFIKERSIYSVLEYGCGDGNQQALIDVHFYVGIDISKTIISKCQKDFTIEGKRTFRTVNDFEKLNPGSIFGLTLSLDVLFHIIEYDLWEKYLHNLFNWSYKYVIIYANDNDPEEGYAQHYLPRKFTPYIKEHFPEWELIITIPNLYPKQSFSNFYIYQKKEIK